MSHPKVPDGERLSAPTGMDEVLRRLRVLEQNQRDILFLLRSMRHAWHVHRLNLSPETKRIHRAVLRLAPFNGVCPNCRETRVVAEDGAQIPPAEFDHFVGPAYNAPVHTWLVCQPCHKALSDDRHLLWYQVLATRFRPCQAAVDAYARAFGHRTPGRMHFGRYRP